MMEGSSQGHILKDVWFLRLNKISNELTGPWLYRFDDNNCWLVNHMNNTDN